MPKAGGLPDVVQKIGVDSSEAVTGYINVRDMAREASGANDMLAKSFGELKDRMREMSEIAGRGSLLGSRDSVNSLKDYITGIEQVRQGYANLAEASKQQIQLQQEQAKVAGQLFADMAKQQQAAYSDMYRQALTDNKQFNAQQVAAARATATQQKLAAMDALAAQKAAYTQVQANAISENRIMDQRIRAEKALQAEIQKTGDILDKRVTSGSNIVPSVIAQRDARDIRIDSAANASRYADDILMQRLITGQAQAANAAEIYSTSRVSDVANAFADAAASRLFPARGGGADASTAATTAAGDAITALQAIAARPSSPGGGFTGPPGGGGPYPGYGTYDPNATRVGGATLEAINTIRDSNKTYSILPGLLAAGGASAIAGIISSPGARAAIVDGAFAVARNVSLAGRGMGVLAAAAGGGLLGAGAAGLGAIVGGGNFDAGLATTHGAAVTNFLGTWLPRIHYGIMATNEILATAGPATVAALAAGAVGLEGGQTAYTRLSAINAVGQSLGPALGQTPGQFLGLGNTLQKAQTLADPGVWALLGAAKAVVTGGGGGAFTQLGTNTIGMIDRFAAKVTTAFTSGGAGKQMSDLVSQGTQYLQQFGDVAANIGTTLLHVAPVLPGVGGDLLSTVQVATRGLSNLTGIMPPPLLGAVLAGEAAGRYGPGLVGALGNYAGRVPGGFLGTTARLATADDIALGAAAPLAVSGLPAAEVGETIGGTGLAGALGSAGFLPLAALGVAAYTVGKIITGKSPTQQWIGGLQNAVNQGNLTQDYGLLSSDMTQYAGMSGGPQTVGAGQGMKNALGGTGYDNAKNFFQSMLASILPGMPFVRTPAGDASAALQDAASQFNNLLAAGPAIQGMLGGGSMSNAYAMADMAGLTGSQLSALINGKPGTKAYDDIKNQLLNAQAGFKIMGSSPGVYGANVNAVQAMSGLAGTKLSTVNQAWDQIVSNATGGTASATGFAAGIGVISALGKTPGVAKALTSFSSPASQQAWAAFSSPSTTTPGALQQAQSMADWMRTAMTVSQGKIGQGQYNEVTAYQAKQLLPYAKSSPAALAQLGVLSQEMGGPGYNPLENQKQNYAAISKAIDGAAGSVQQYNKNVNAATIATAGVSQQALNFGATMKENTYAALSGGASSLPQVATDRLNFLKSITGGDASAASMKALAQDFAAGGITGKDVGAVIPQMLAGKGLSVSQIGKITSQIQVQVTADTSGVKSQLNALQSSKKLNIGVNADASKILELQHQLAALKDKNVTAKATAEGAAAVAALQQEIAALKSKTVSIVVVESVVGSFAGTPVANLPGGRHLTLQTGRFIPGYGGGDIIPAMLEPGELVVPKHLVAGLRPLFGGKIPGFQSGGIAPAGTAAGIQAQINAQYGILDRMYATNAPKSQIDAFWSTVLDPLYAAKDKLTATTTAVAKAGTAAGGTFIASVSGALANDTTANGQKIATSLINTIGNAMTYARSVSASAVSGLGLANMTVGIDGGGGAAPPGAPGYNAATWNTAVANFANNAAPTPSVQDNMKTYLSTVQSFTKDLHTATSQGLNKSLLSQIISAGPTQGDSLLQSIMGSTGGTKLANSLFGQITKASNALGAQAGESMNPGVKIAANLTSASASTVLKGLDGKKVTVTVEAKGMQAIQSAINSLNGKTITITEIIKTVGGQITAKGHAAGGLIYGSGYGDTVPAWLSPGEAVIPSDLVPYFAPMLGAYGVPGFSGGSSALGLGISSSGMRGYSLGSAMTMQSLMNPSTFGGGMSASPDSTPWQMSQNQGSNHSFNFNFHGRHDLSPSDIRQVVQHVEAKLLSNAKNNRSSGLTLSGYGT